MDSNQPQSFNIIFRMVSNRRQVYAIAMVWSSQLISILNWFAGCPVLYIPFRNCLNRYPVDLRIHTRTTMISAKEAATILISIDLVACESIFIYIVWTNDQECLPSHATTTTTTKKNRIARFSWFFAFTLSTEQTNACNAICWTLIRWNYLNIPVYVIWWMRMPRHNIHHNANAFATL